MTENKRFTYEYDKYNRKITIRGHITPVSATREVTYDISKFIEAYLDIGKTKEEAREDFKKILEEVVDELSEMRGFEND